jgi:Fe-S cluster assembly iron-binding protein IscA
VSISATPDEGWEFVNWTGDVANPNLASTSITMDGDKTITANFIEEEIIVYSLTINTIGNGSTTPATGTHQHNEGEVVSISATPDEGWKFDSWSGDVANPNLASTSITMDGDKTITASFGDAVPPLISGISAVGASRTAINITWITDELSDSQVEFWASPGQLSPLDSTLVTEHSVRLTELTPATAYYYKVMSRDASGNLTVSEEYSFTTAATEATFAISGWNTSLDNIETGTRLTISFSVVNNGDLDGTYTANLNVNGNVEDSQEVSLEAGASQQISLNTTQSIIGNYTVSIDGFTISFSVAASGDGASPLTYIGIIIGLLLLFVAIIIYLKRGQIKERFGRRQAFAGIPKSYIPQEDMAAVEASATAAIETAPPPFEEEAVEEKEEEEEVEEEVGGLTITALAMLKLRQALQAKTLDPDIGFRIIPSTSKPSQLKMILDRVKKEDKVLESEGTKILFISPELIPKLEDMVIDYHETPQGGGFVISRLSEEK